MKALMTALKQWWQRIRDVDLSRRQATALAMISGALLAGLMVVWLTMSTRTALLDRQLETLDAQQTILTDEINKTWTEIGDVTVPSAMEDRARQLGFKPADKIEYLVTTPDVTPTAAVSDTVPISATETLTP
jgi:hypothetical protein